MEPNSIQQYYNIPFCLLCTSIYADIVLITFGLNGVFWWNVMCCSWVGLVSKNYEIERACMELEAEVQELEHKAKKLKKWNVNTLFSTFCNLYVFGIKEITCRPVWCMHLAFYTPSRHCFELSCVTICSSSDGENCSQYTTERL